MMKSLSILSKISLLAISGIISINTINGQDIDRAKTTFVLENIDDQNRFSWPRLFSIEQVIPLETNSSSVLGTFTKGIVRENRFIIYDNKSRMLKAFDENGKFLFQVGTKGNGPEDYTDMRDFMAEGDNIWCLDNKKINCFDLKTGKYKSSIKYETRYLNPTAFLIFHPDDYYLYQSNPYSTSKEPVYRLLHFQNGKQTNSFFKWDHHSVDGVRFLEGLNKSYILIPVEGEYNIFKITDDSIFIAYEMDFKDKKIPRNKLIIKPDYKTGNNEYLESDYYKSIKDIYETEQYIYFTCVGAGAMGFEVLINKKTKLTFSGRLDYYYNPRIFYSDGKYFYGYYNSTSFTKERVEDSKSEFFNSVVKKIGIVNLEDNFVLVKFSIPEN